MSEVHGFALGLNSWNVSAEIFKFVDQENSNVNENPTPNPNAGESFLRAFYFVWSMIFLNFFYRLSFNQWN